jgi:hypothetical protein
MPDTDIRNFLFACLDTACARVNAARVDSIKQRLNALHGLREADAAAISRAVETLKHEEDRRQRIVVALAAPRQCLGKNGSILDHAGGQWAGVK